MDVITFVSTSEDLSEFEVVDFTGEDIIPEIEMQESVSDPVYEVPVEIEPEEAVYIPIELPEETTVNEITQFEVTEQETIQEKGLTQEEPIILVEQTTEGTTENLLETLQESNILQTISDQLQVLVEASNDEGTEETTEQSNIITMEEATTEETTEYNIDDIYRSLSGINENLTYISQQNERSEETFTNYMTGVLGILLVGIGAFAAYAAFSKIYG